MLAGRNNATVAGDPRSAAYCAKPSAVPGGTSTPSCYFMPAFRKVMNTNDFDAPTTLVTFYAAAPGEPLVTPYEPVPPGQRAQFVAP